MRNSAQKRYPIGIVVFLVLGRLCPEFWYDRLSPAPTIRQAPSVPDHAVQCRWTVPSYKHARHLLVAWTHINVPRPLPNVSIPSAMFGARLKQIARRARGLGARDGGRPRL